jgi:SNF2-related domain/Helicase conserved C-terminal domain
VSLQREVRCHLFRLGLPKSSPLSGFLRRGFGNTSRGHSSNVIAGLTPQSGGERGEVGGRWTRRSSPGMMDEHQLHRNGLQLTVDHESIVLAWPYFDAIIQANQPPISKRNKVMPSLTPERRDPTKSGQAPNRKPAGKRKAKAVLDRPALPPGWLTSDADEVNVRRWRGRTEIISVKALEPDHPYFGTFRAQSASGGSYEVEIRSLNERVNSCGCIDYRVNGLGTCKHIEGTIEAMARGRAKSFRAAKATGSSRVEVFLDRRTSPLPMVTWPAGSPGRNFRAVRNWLGPYLAADGTLTRDPERIESLIAAWNKAPKQVRTVLRASRHLAPWLDRIRRERHRVEGRAAFEADLEAGRKTLDIVKHPLLPYQCEGVLHLAFGERALLADDMGLGKTIQGIAACVLLAKLKQIGRVLVVCPASLKAEWEEQIARFCDRSTRVVFGSKAQRQAAYRDPAFFTIVNYEQVVGDAEEINSTLKPDIIVLDEAQRIKNWQTKTARRVKSLRSPYAFVLTGTPLENRIDELYSIVQYLDPEILGPLFRFNRDFYKLDDRGRPVDYQNLADLRQRLRPLLLRRRKSDVETQLPGRTVKTYFVPMAEEQKLRYEEYYVPASRLIAKAQNRPLTQTEFELLQKLFACMRMVCDTPAILDPTCRVSPKLEELEGILGDLLDDPERKVIVFSEWERMLTMVRELAGEMGFDAAWHTGSLPQQRRRAEINRFKHDPACRLFLSTDSGSVGLNLQAASSVINVDLPWNPAKLEQRIARAWRKNQMRTVDVVNLVTEDSIEHNILHLLGRKQALADGVIDGEGDLASLKMPSGRAAFVERMQAMLAASPRAVARVLPPEEILVADLVERHGDKVLLAEARRGFDGRAKLLIVFDLEPPMLVAETARLTAVDSVAVDVIDRNTWLAMQRFAASGLLQFTHESRLLHRSVTLSEQSADAPAPDQRASQLMAEAQRALRMARVLASGGFPDEAPALLAKVLQKAGAARMAERRELPAAVSSASDTDIRRLVERREFPPDALAILDAGQPSAEPPNLDVINVLVSTAEQILVATGHHVLAEPSLRAA